MLNFPILIFVNPISDTSWQIFTKLDESDQCQVKLYVGLQLLHPLYVGFLYIDVYPRYFSVIINAITLYTIYDKLKLS